MKTLFSKVNIVCSSKVVVPKSVSSCAFCTFGFYASPFWLSEVHACHGIAPAANKEHFLLYSRNPGLLLHSTKPWKRGGVQHGYCLLGASSSPAQGIVTVWI